MCAAQQTGICIDMSLQPFGPAALALNIETQEAFNVRASEAGMSLPKSSLILPAFPGRGPHRKHVAHSKHVAFYQ